MSRGIASASVLAMLILSSCAHREASSPTARPGDAPEAPQAYGLDLTLLDDNGELKMSSFAGRLVLLMVSIPGCEACAHLEPQVKELAVRLQGESVALSLVTILLERPPSDDVGGHGQGLRWADPRLVAGETKLGLVDTVPLMWLLSRSGVPLFRYVGSQDEVVALLEEDLRGYLKVETSF